MNPNAFALASLRQAVKPFGLHYYTRLTSTNDYAAKLRRARKLYAPTIVLTSHQIAGRGRGSNSWWSGRGSLTVTFVLPTDEKIPPNQVPIIAGMAVRSALVEHFHADAIRLKWPNDLWHDDLKLGGLLCERLEKVDLVGIGLNVNILPSDITPSLRHRVTSLRAIIGREHALNDVLGAIAGAMNRFLLKRQFGSFATLLHQYNAIHALNGRRIRVIENAGQSISGTCDGLDGHGRLLLRTSQGVVPVIAGHVELR